MEGEKPIVLEMADNLQTIREGVDELRSMGLTEDMIVTLLTGDMIVTKMEVNLVAGDRELQKLAIQKRLIDNRIMNRIDQILNDYRELPYQVSEKGARIDLEKYDVPRLKLCCPKKGLDFEVDLFNMIGYLRPISKGMTTEGAIPVIKDVLKGALIKVEEPMVGEQLEAHLASKGE